MEFYANMTKSMFNPVIKEFGKAVVKGISFEFTPAYLDYGKDNVAEFTPDYDEIMKVISVGVRTL